MRDVLTDYQRLRASGEPVGRAVVTTVWGSAPRPPGACLLATPGGAIAGSVSGGCVEGATVTEIHEAIARGTAKLVEYGVTDEAAWEVGLACGGTIRVFIEPTVREEIVEAATRGGTVVATVIEGAEDLGASLIVYDDGTLVGPQHPSGKKSPGGSALHDARDAVVAAASDALRHETSRTATVRTTRGAELTVFLEVHPRQAKLVIFGGVHVASALVALAKTMGFRTIVADGRAAFLTRERFPDADQLVEAWPAEAFEQVGLDASTYVCVLSHDPKFDEPALEIALRSAAPYVGAIGSRKTQHARRERLRAAGITDDQLARLRGPIGLDLGGREPHEIALAILAEITVVRYGGSGKAKGIVG